MQVGHQEPAQQKEEHDAGLPAALAQHSAPEQRLIAVVADNDNQRGQSAQPVQLRDQPFPGIQISFINHGLLPERWPPRRGARAIGCAKIGAGVLRQGQMGQNRE